MKRTGVISFDLLLGQPDCLKHYLLGYDELWVPWLSKSFPSRKEIREWSLDEDHLASISWLQSEGFLHEPSVDILSARPDAIVHALTSELGRIETARDRTYATARQAALASAAHSFNYDIALTRLTGYVAWRDKEEVVYPVVFPFADFEGLPPELRQGHSALSVVFKRFPVPSESLPLEDILAYKRDPSTQYKFDRFWQWVRKMSDAGHASHLLEEELDSLTADYSAHLKQLTAEVGHQRLETMLSIAGDVLEDVVKLRWGNLTRRFLQLRKIQILASGAEMKLPGSEIAYVTEASALLARQARSA